MTVPEIIMASALLSNALHVGYVCCVCTVMFAAHYDSGQALCSMAGETEV